MPRVSVIIPNYNHGRFLERRIRSVLDQTYQDLEVIFLDDASTDNSRKVFGQFSNDPRIRAIFNDTNSGSVFKQWNKGFREATGEYIWVAESDDCADKHFLETLVTALDVNPTAGVAYCQSWMIDGNDNKIQIMEHARKGADAQRWMTDFFKDGRSEVADYFILSCMINNVSSALLRRSTVEQIGYADESLKVCGDWLFWAKMLLAADIAFVAKPLNYWRTHSGTVRNATLRNGTMVMESYLVAAYIADATPINAHIIEQARAKRFWSWMCYNEDNLFPIAQNLKIYKIARQFDPHINRRLLRYLPVAPLRFAGRRLLHQIQKLRHRNKRRTSTLCILP